MNPVRLHITKHPDDLARRRYDSLFGLDAQKDELFEYLLGVLRPERFAGWERKHHPHGLALARRLEYRPPLVILAGDVGCGKTALASSIGTPMADAIDARITALETPSDIRGSGMVGELSARVTAAFDEARTQIGTTGTGLLVIDEGDDLATSREQNQAHHEDRAGLNVLIKQIDSLMRDRIRLAVVLVTNRLAALDPALVRRGHVIYFARPSEDARRAFFRDILDGIHVSAEDLEELMRATARDVPFTFSDLLTRIAEPALRQATREDVPLTFACVLAIARAATPSPVFKDEQP